MNEPRRQPAYNKTNKGIHSASGFPLVSEQQTMEHQLKIKLATSSLIRGRGSQGSPVEFPQACVLQDCCREPEHSAPPNARAGFVLQQEGKRREKGRES